MENRVTEDELEQEPVPKTIVLEPAIELLQNPEETAKVWSDETEANPMLLEQVEAHSKHIACLNDVLGRIPHPLTPIEKAVEVEQITERQAEKLYESLADILASEDYARLVLYLPFELLPRSSWVPTDGYLADAIEKFKASYKAAWRDLLSVHDVRANFVDGDVLEVHVRTGGPPRVVKAAHLIPKLVEAGMLKTLEVITLAEETDDELLKTSVADTLVVLDDISRISESDLARMESSVDEAVRRNAQVIKRDRKDPLPQLNPITAASIKAGFEAIKTDEGPQIDGYITERRLAWLKEVRTDRHISELADQVSGALLARTLSAEEVKGVLPCDTNTLAAQILIEAVQKTVEQAVLTGRSDSQAFFNDFEDVLLTIWSKDEPAVKDRLVRAFRHLYRVGMVDRDQLASLGISLPKLSGPVSSNLELIPHVADRIQSIAASIESDPDLSPLVYPVVSFGGSSLKGYGEQDSDVDVAIFIKPNVPEDQKSQIRALWKAKFENEDDPIEIWLDENDDQLTIRKFAAYDPYIASKYWTHILFGTVWAGNKDAIHELRSKLLPPYFIDSDEYAYGHRVRNLYLERMEQDLLQYRLMHKGYKRHYPSLNTVAGLPHADLIDGHSVFWDPGYRRLATELFIKMVFLPKIT